MTFKIKLRNGNGLEPVGLEKLNNLKIRYVCTAFFEYILAKI